MEQGFSLKRYWEAFGNGDEKKGRELLEKIVERIEHAREKHKWGPCKEINSPYKALTALNSELSEWANAIYQETEERQLDEALDILAVGVRMANQEYKD